MKLIFVDTSAWIALNFQRDQLYSKAVTMNRQLLKQGHRYITSNFVLDETYTGMLNKIPHHRITEFGENIRNSKLIRVIHIDQHIEDKAWNLFSRYGDKLFSFTDCTSFIIMQEYKISTAFTNDHHFEQFGFKILL